MTNPARELAALLSAWEVPARTSPFEHRTVAAKGADSTFYDQMRQASRLLARLDEEMERLQARGVDVTDFQDCYPRWANAVYSVDEEWSAATPTARPVLSPSDFSLLRVLGTAIDLAGGAVAVSPATIDGVLKQVSAAEDFVKAASGINESLRLHLLGLLAAIREAVNNGHADRTGPLVAEFVGTASLVAERVPEAERSGWRAMAQEWVVQFSASVAASSAVPLIAATVAAITS